ncbi:MAG: hypothetical protein AB7E68_01980 [Candidatus Babeliales bacterium]
MKKLLLILLALGTGLTQGMEKKPQFNRLLLTSSGQNASKIPSKFKIGQTLNKPTFTAASLNLLKKRSGNQEYSISTNSEKPVQKAVEPIKELKQSVYLNFTLDPKVKTVAFGTGENDENIYLPIKTWIDMNNAQNKKLAPQGDIPQLHQWPQFLPLEKLQDMREGDSIEVTIENQPYIMKAAKLCWFAPSLQEKLTVANKEKEYRTTHLTNNITFGEVIKPTSRLWLYATVGLCTIGATAAAYYYYPEAMTDTLNTVTSSIGNFFNKVGWWNKTETALPTPELEIPVAVEQPEFSVQPALEHIEKFVAQPVSVPEVTTPMNILMGYAQQTKEAAKPWFGYLGGYVAGLFKNYKADYRNENLYN